MSKDSEKGKYTSPEGSATWEYISAISCSSLIFGIGSLFGWGSPILGRLIGPDSPIPFTESDASAMTVSFSIGFTLGPTLNSVMADKLGRRNSLLVICIPMILNWGLIAIANDKWVLFVARFFGGIAASLGLCLAPMYMGEIASVKLRGTLGTLIGTISNTGLFCAFLLIPYVSISTSASICMSTTIASMISLWFIPESPYFLAMIGKTDEAEAALEKLRGKTDVSEELDLVKRTVSRKGEEDESLGDGPKKFSAFKELVTVVANRRAFYINLLLVFALQLGGYIVSMAFGHIIFEAMKTGVPANISATIMAIIQLIFNILTTFVIDKYGRRPLLLISGVTSGTCLLIISVHFYLLEHTSMDVTPYGILPLIAMFVNIAAVSIGLMPMQLVIQSEILATEIKALAGCIIGMVGGVISIIVSASYLTVVITWGVGYSVPFLGFTLITWTATALILKLLPETKGKTFLEIQRDLSA